MSVRWSDEGRDGIMFTRRLLITEKLVPPIVIVGTGPGRPFGKAVCCVMMKGLQEKKKTSKVVLISGS